MLSTFQKFLSLWTFLERINKKNFIALVLLMIISAFIEIISIGSVLPFLSALLNPNFLDQNFFGFQVKELFGGKSREEIILLILIAFVSIIIFSSIFKTLLLWFTTKFNADIGTDIANKVFIKLIDYPYEEYIQQSSDKLISDIANKVTAVIFSVIFPTLLFLSTLIQIVGIIVLLLFVNTLLVSYIILFFLVFYLITFIFVKKKLFENSKIIADEESILIKFIQEGLGGKREITINNLHSFFINKFKNSNQLLRVAQSKNNFLGILPRYVIEALAITIIAFTFYFLLFNNVSEKPQGEVLALIGLLALAGQKLLPLTQQTYTSLSRVMGSRESLKSIVDILNLKFEKESYKNNVGKNLTFIEKISLKNITYEYEKNKKIILNLNLDIKKGNKIGIIGKTGSGKSTLIDIIMGLLEPTSGEIRIDNHIIDKDSLDSWQKHVAHVPQNIFLNDDTIMNNVAYGINPKLINKELVKKSIKDADLFEYVSKLERGLDTVIGERGIKLSGGQKQRLAIARALYKQASVIVFDEATSALDIETEFNVMNVVKNFSKDITIIIVAHRIETLKFCDTLYEISNGEISNTGTFDDLKNKSKLLKSIVVNEDI
jgi:ATP-binding cassette, subfamily B, bacterial PglK